MFNYYQQQPIKLREYGRYIQGMAAYLLNIEDRQKRTDYAYALVELMKDFLPDYGDGEDVYNKLWDDLFIMTDFQLDVDAPFPKPNPEQLNRRPDSMPYPQHQLRFRQYGHQVEQLVQMAKKLTNQEEQKIAFGYIGSLMKIYSQSWNQEGTESATIYQQLEELAGAPLPFSLEEAENLELFDNLSRRNEHRHHANGGYNSNHKKKKKKKNK